MKDHAGVPHHANVHWGTPIKDIGTLAYPIDEIQLSKRRRVDYDGNNDYCNIESNLYPQRRRHSFFFNVGNQVFSKSSINSSVLSQH